MNLLSEDVVVARSQAEELLGMQYWDDADTLRRRLEETIAAVADTPLHLFPVRTGGLVYKALIWLARIGLPVQKVFPDPVGKVARVVARAIRVNRFTVVSGSDFAYHGIVGSDRGVAVSEVFAFQLGRPAKFGDAVRIDVASRSRIARAAELLWKGYARVKHGKPRA
jgi:hypothetical protein